MKYYNVESKNKSIFKIFAIYYICMAVFCGIRILTAAGYTFDGIAGDIYMSLVVQIGIMFILPAILYCLLLKVRPKQLFKS